MIRLLVVLLALGAVTGVVGCGGSGGGSTSPVVSSTTRQYEGTWTGTFVEGTDQIQPTGTMSFILAPTGDITGGTTNPTAPPTLRSSNLYGRMTGDNSFDGSLRFLGGQTDISGTVRLEAGKLVGAYKYHSARTDSDVTGTFTLARRTAL